MKALTQVARKTLRRIPLTGPVGLLVAGALLDDGWLRSFRETRSVDRSGRPVPWYTYPCAHFLEPRLGSAMRVFEYGAGMSTLWYAARVGEVVAVEHDPAWARRVTSAGPEGITVVVAERPDDYVRAVNGHGVFDVVVIDGMERTACLEEALPNLSEHGVFVWDNSDREEFRELLPALADRGFRSLSFRGMGPINRQPWETAVVYRDGNCLGI